MRGGEAIIGMRDKGGRRSGMDRRNFSISRSMPERRSGEERRGSLDRRSRRDLGDLLYLRRNTDRYLEFANTQKGLILGVLLSLPLWALIIFNYYR